MCRAKWRVCPQNQDTNRLGTSASWDAVDIIIDERTLHEVYLPASKAPLQETNSGSMMCSYNKINGQYACENE